jgi:hypothetical protein
MNDESKPENTPADDKGSQSNFANARRVMNNTEQVTGTPRLIVNGALLGTCFVFIAAMLSVQKLDDALIKALVAFAIAIPILVYGFMFASYKVKPVPGHLLLVGLQAGAWIIEGLGWIAVVVGVFAVIAHLSPIAFKALIITSISVVVIGFIGSFIGLVVYAIRKYGGKKQKQEVAQVEVMKTDSNGQK